MVFFKRYLKQGRSVRFLRGRHGKDVASAEGVPNLGGLGATPPYRKFLEMPFPTISQGHFNK